MREYACWALEQIEGSAKSGIWEPHWGCAVLAGAFLIGEKRVEPSAHAAIIGTLDRIRESHPIPGGRGPEGEKLSLLDFQGEVFKALADNADEPRQLGHDVIYAAYVLHALELFEVRPSRELLTSLVKAIQSIKASGPGWITINGKNEQRMPADDEVVSIDDPWSAFENFDRALEMEAGDMQLGHLLTHGHAISLLSNAAGPALTRRLGVALARRLAGLRKANHEQKGGSPLPRRRLDPREKEYWALSALHGDMHGHVQKYAFSFLDLNRTQITDAQMESFGRILWPGASL